MSNLIKLILILQILVFFINTFLGILVFRADSKSRFNILFCIYTLGLAFWNLCLFLTITAIGGPSMQLYCSRLAFSFGVILFNSFLYFALIYPNIKIIKFWIDALFILVNAVFVYLTLTPLLIAGNVQARGGFITGEFGSLMPIFSFYLPAFIFLSLVILVWKLFKYKGTIRVKIWYTAAGFAFFAVPMIITNLILPIFFQNFRYNNLGPIFSLPMVAVIAYVIIRHRFMGIRQAVARLVTYFFLIITLGVFYAAGVSLTTSFVIKDPNMGGNLGISAIFAVIIAFSFQPLRSAFEKATNKIFYRHHYDENNLLYDLTLTMSSSLRLNEMNGKLLKKIIGEMHIS
ncbi:MAG: histidine kinase N-terminal 7TM domain-containing protein, partial [Patescibacteria group bacterium]